MLNGIAATREVVLSIEITSLPVGGMMIFMACGTTTYRMVWPQDIARAVEASAWPSSTDSRPARTISDM